MQRFSIVRTIESQQQCSLTNCLLLWWGAGVTSDTGDQSRRILKGDWQGSHPIVGACFWDEDLTLALTRLDDQLGSWQANPIG